MAASRGDHAQAQAPTRWALLIGVTRFTDPAMTRFNLDGPQNDVTLMRTLLEREPFSMPAATVTVLAGLPDELDRRPTRSNIEREFARLADRVTAGDQVLVLMAGHGSQQPADADPSDPEPDGLDEIFLPADTTGWDGTRGLVNNAIVDDDVRGWVTELRNRGAFVFLLFDSCQSGTMARGAPETIRQISMSELGIPQPETGNLTGERSRGQEGARGLLDLPESAAGLAAIYAAQSTETTPEKPLPDENGPVHGLFTYTIASILQESSSPLTYRELAQGVLGRYRSLGRYGPTPLFEGGGLDQEVLGQRTWPDRPAMLLGRRSSDADWEIDAGSIHGLTTGSVVELFPPAGSPRAESRVGFARVTEVRPTAATIETVEHEGVPRPTESALEPGTRARVAVYNYGDLRLRVAVDTPEAGRGPTARFRVLGRGDSPAPLERALDDLESGAGGLAVRVETAEADWFVRVADEQVTLVPASGWQPTSGSLNADGNVTGPRQFDLGRVDSSSFGDLLNQALRRIARVSNLLHLASSSHPQPTLQLVVERYDNPEGGSGTPVPSASGDVVVRAGQYLGFRIRNDDTRPLDVTLLHVDPAFGIQSLFPQAGEEGDVRLSPGEERRFGPYEVTDTPTGWEYALAIAVVGGASPQNFAMLAQDSLATGATRGQPSPLQTLLQDAAFGTGGAMRGLRASSELDTFVVKVAAWRSEAQR